MVKNISLEGQLNLLKKNLITLNKYKLFIYIVFVLILYGFLILKINTLDQFVVSNNSSSQISGTTTPQHLNQAVIDQLQQLQNNNVTVQTLFEQARNNPF